MRTADRGSSWDDEIAMVVGANEDASPSDGTLVRKPTSTPKAEAENHEERSESRKASIVVPRAIDAFVETEEEVGACCCM